MDEIGVAVTVECIPFIRARVSIIGINFRAVAGFNLINLTVVVVSIFCCVVCAANGFFGCL